MRPSVASKPLTVPHEFLESALSLYFEHKAYSSALHLAGAAEELLGKLLREKGVASYIDSIPELFMDGGTRWSASGRPGLLMAHACH